MQKSENRQTQMFAVVEELSQSKLTLKEFCHQRSISMNCFYYWQKKYRRQAREEQMDAAERKVLRQEKASPILAELHGWLKENTTQTLPKSAIGIAIAYTLHLCHGYCVILTTAGTRSTTILSKIPSGR